MVKFLKKKAYYDIFIGKFDHNSTYFSQNILFYEIGSIISIFFSDSIVSLVLTTLVKEMSSYEWVEGLRYLLGR